MRRRRETKLHGPDDVDDDTGWPPETIRSYHPELTRCDHCQILDVRTERVGLLENGEQYWLHPECIALFMPIRSEMVPGGVIATYDRGQTWEAWSLVNGQLDRIKSFGIAEGNSEERANKAAIAAARRSPEPLPDPGWLRQKVKGKIIPYPEDGEKTEASRKFWRQFNDEQRYWSMIGMQSERKLLEQITPL